MKKRLIILLLCLSVCSFSATAKKPLRPYISKLQWEMFGLGFHFAIPTELAFTRDNMLDRVFSFDYGGYIQPLGMSYFFDKHWGIETKFQIGFIKVYSESILFDNIKAQYGDNYYIGRKDNRQEGLFRIFLGLVYRMEYRRLFIHPKLLVGVTSLGQGRLNAEFKEKNSHNILDVSYYNYRGNYKENYGLIFSPAVSFGIKGNERLHINFEIASSYFRSSKYRVEYSVTDRNTGNVLDSELTRYKTRNIFGISIGFGLMLAF